MPSQQARLLTQVHRAELAAVSAEVVTRVGRIARKATTADIDAWWAKVVEQIIAIVAGGWATTRRQGALYVVRHGLIDGVRVDPVEAQWVTDQVATSLRVQGPVAFKQNMAISRDPVKARAVMTQTLTGSSQRLAMAGERDTVAATVEHNGDIVGWRRVTDADPCYFCALLVSRGAVYKSAGTAGAKTNARFVGEGLFKYHDHDQCTAEPLYEHEDEPPEASDLYQQYRDVVDKEKTSGADSIRAWRRYWENRNTTT